MKYYIKEEPYESQNRGAWGKAHSDINNILYSLEFSPLSIKQENHKGLNRFLRQIKCLDQWKKKLSVLVRNDVLVLQYPPLENSFFLPQLLRELTKKDVKIVTVVHDLVPLTVAPFYKKFFYLKEDCDIINASSYLIVHNDRMAEYLSKKVNSNTKIISLGIFDYCMDIFDENLANQRQISRTQPIIIAGTLNPKFSGKYLSKLPENIEFNLFGNGYIDQGKDNIHYYGSFSSAELLYKYCGSFGLVWYGDKSEVCSGKIKNYLKIINPHRTSSYLAAGIPVICWSQTGIADFLIKNNCGFVVESLYDIADIIHNMSDEKYAEMKNNAEIIGQKLRSGFYLRKAISNIESC